jgi:ketosteroid isomerase-like protein
MTKNLSAAAAALKHSFETGDRSRWEARFAPGCVNWHNSDRLEVPAAGFGGAGALQAILADCACEVVRDVAFENGALICIVVRGTVRANGKPFEAHNAIVLTTSAEGIVRIDDYVDPSFGSQLMAGGE